MTSEADDYVDTNLAKSLRKDGKDVIYAILVLIA